jgi:hypothetical protein
MPVQARLIGRLLVNGPPLSTLALPNLAVLAIKAGACGAAGPASAPGSAPGRPPGRTPAQDLARPGRLMRHAGQRSTRSPSAERSGASAQLGHT